MMYVNLYPTTASLRARSISVKIDDSLHGDNIKIV